MELNQSLHKYLNSDEVYQKNLKKLSASKELYKSMELPDHQKLIVDFLLDAKDSCEFDRVANAYLAGLYDGYRILKFLGLTNE